MRPQWGSPRGDFEVQVGSWSLAEGTPLTRDTHVDIGVDINWHHGGHTMWGVPPK